MTGHTRAAMALDAPAIAAICNQGIAERIATFETEPRDPGVIAGWIGTGCPLVVVERAGMVVGFAAAFPYRPRACYAGVREFSVYVDRDARGRGFGRMALAALEAAVVADGGWKLVSRVFVENRASRRLLAAAGFREVGIYERHGRLDGRWRDCVIVEKLIGEES